MNQDARLLCGGRATRNTHLLLVGKDSQYSGSSVSSAQRLRPTLTG